jgi:hypothetical protein
MEEKNKKQRLVCRYSLFSSVLCCFSRSHGRLKKLSIDKVSHEEGAGGGVSKKPIFDKREGQGKANQ